MSSFEMVHRRYVVGKLVCFDRLIFNGHPTGLFSKGAFNAFLSSQGVLLKLFAPYVKGVSEEFKAHLVGLAAENGRPDVYLEQATTRPAAGPARTTWPGPSPSETGSSTG